MAQAQRADEDEGQQRSARRPVHTARVGPVEIPVWENTGKNGKFYTASSPTISYQDEKGEWKQGSSYGMSDLLHLAEAAREASAKIRELSQSRTQTRG